MNYFAELTVQNNAVKHLAKRLYDGTLVLFIGAGASRGFGLPNWVELVNDLRKEVGLPIISNPTSADDLQLSADEVIDKIGSVDNLIKKIEELLYKKVEFESTKVFENHLLISISALLMGSKRGHVTRVVSLNYDNMLEWFLSLFGFVVKSVYKLPDLEGSEDVRIYHPHGYIPSSKITSEKSDFVILGMDSANTRLGTPGDPWFEKVRSILDSGFCLFIGMSENTLLDRAIAPLFKTSGEKVKLNRPLGVWVLLSDPERADFQRYNIAPLVLSSPLEISDFLLKICQEARKKLV